MRGRKRKRCREKRHSKTKAYKAAYQTKTNCSVKKCVEWCKIEKCTTFFLSSMEKENRRNGKKHTVDDVDDYNDMVIRRFVALTLTSHQRNQLTRAQRNIKLQHKFTRHSKIKWLRSVQNNTHVQHDITENICCRFYK